MEDGNGRTMSTKRQVRTWADVVDPKLRRHGVTIGPEVVAEALGKTTQTVDRLLRDRGLKGTKVGGTWYVSRDWFMTYLGLEDDD